MISVAIMAHPARAPFVATLKESLDVPASEVRVAWDTKSDRWDTGTRALKSYKKGATHHLVLQDDAIVCQDLVAGLDRLLEVVPPGCPMCLYTGTYRKFIHTMNVEYMTEPFSWMVTPGILWGVGILVPTSDISDIISFGRDRPEPNYDMRVSRYYELVKKCGVWAPIPTLVDHRDSPSLIPGRTGNRRAWKFLGTSKSALEAPYDLGVRELNLVRGIED